MPVIEHFPEAQRELLKRWFLEHWQIVPVGVREQKDFLFIWDAGSAWWKTEAQLPELQAKYGLGETHHIDSDPVIDPFLTALPEPSTGAAMTSATDTNSAARLLDEIIGLSGRRKDPDVWEKWWKRAIAAVPHPGIWLRIGEVKERRVENVLIWEAISRS